MVLEKERDMGKGTADRYHRYLFLPHLASCKQIFVFVRAEYLSDKGKLNQVVLWDSIIQQKVKCPAWPVGTMHDVGQGKYHPMHSAQEKARIKLKKHKSKYAFIDIGRNLRDKDVNLTLVWDIMPRIGALRMDSRSFRVGKMPAAYVS